MERGGGCAEVRAVKSGIRVKSGGGGVLVAEMRVVGSSGERWEGAEVRAVEGRIGMKSVGGGLGWLQR